MLRNLFSHIETVGYDAMQHVLTCNIFPHEDSLPLCQATILTHRAFLKTWLLCSATVLTQTIGYYATQLVLTHGQLATMLCNLFSHATYSHMWTVGYYAMQLHIDSWLCYGTCSHTYTSWLFNLVLHTDSWPLCHATCSHMQPILACGQLVAVLCNCSHR